MAGSLDLCLLPKNDLMVADINVHFWDWTSGQKGRKLLLVCAEFKKQIKKQRQSKEAAHPALSSWKCVFMPP